MSNYQSSFHVIDLKLDIQPSLLHCGRSACSAASRAAACYRLQHDARWNVVMNIYVQAAGGAYRRHYSRVSKQAGDFRVHSTFRTCFSNNVFILICIWSVT